MTCKVIKFGALGFICFFLCSLVLIFPNLSAAGARDGILLCGEVIIPSLFPFCVLSLFCQKSGLISFISKIFSPISKTFFHLSGEEFCIFLMSFFAGYPVGMRMIKEMYDNGSISLQRARKMALYCVNAGPAFIVSAIGGGMLCDRTLGKYLLMSQAFATLLLCFFIEFKSKADNTPHSGNNLSFCDAFVESTADGAKSVFSICGWVILFSAFLSVVNCGIFPTFIIKALKYTMEVTTGAASAKGNILIISALLSFCGFSVHCQIYSVGKGCAPKYGVFLICRTIHAIISVCVTYAFLYLDNRTIHTISNGINTVRENTSFTYTSAAALILMSVFFMISVSTQKKYKLV